MSRLLWASILIFLVGCGKGFQINSSIGSNASFFKESNSKSFIPESDQVASDCAQTGEICIYLKNPVFQERKLISFEDLPSLRAAQNFSVRLTGVDRGHFLKSKQFDILSVEGERLSLASALESRGFDSDQKIASYLNSYYWLNRAHEYLKNHFTGYPSLASEIKVYVDDAFDGWSWETKSIHLDKEKRSALSADVLLLIFGEAQVGFATDGRIYDPSLTTHNECVEDPVGCCKTSSGCSQALLRGSGDFFVSMLFEDAPGIGEFHRQNLSGQSVCGKARTPGEFKDVSLSQAFELCEERKGSTLAMGMVYASIWQEVRRKYEKKKVDQVFLKHLSKLDGTDTFPSALQKIQSTCLEMGLSDLSPIFAQEFSRR